MKNLLIAGCACVLAAALSGCTTAGTQAVAPITQAVAAGLPHCHVSGSFNAGAGGLAGTGTGLAQNFTFDCPAQPWPAATATGAIVGDMTTPATGTSTAK